jgi:ADP-dependent NAD(P)H-hydrate dehydratase / NAD(P)H-hydrate epimerase
MKPLLSTRQMRDVDRRTIDGGLVPGFELMERAGRGVFEIIRRRFAGRLAGRQVVLLCGKGNNGGDGFIVARHLIEEGAGATLFLLAPPDQLAGDARLAFEKLLPLQPAIFPLGDDDARALCARHLGACDLAVDALFGTGISGGLREPGLSAARLLNDFAPRVLSVDIPSGISGDSGAASRESVVADLTVTIGAPKIGLFEHPGAGAAGEVITVDIGYPDEIMNTVTGSRRLFDLESARAALPPFDPAGHKYKRGSVMVIAASRRYRGAALLTVTAALRSGAGMVYAGLPESVAPLVQEQCPSAICFALPETAEGSLTPEAFTVLAPELPRMDALAVGPGLGREEATLAALREFLAPLKMPVLLDADALFAYAGKLDELRAHSGTRILTPHAGELAGLLNAPVDDAEASLSTTAGCNLVVLAKGAPTRVMGEGSEIYTIGAAHPSMARGGTGDLLTGLAGGVLASGGNFLSATLLAATIHGEAGRLAGVKFGRALNSADILDHLAEAWRRVETPHADRGIWN